MTLTETRLFDVYNMIIPLGKNVYRFDEAALQHVKELAKLRRKDWMSTSRWNPYAEETGLISELGFHHAMGTPAGQVVDDFINGLSSDGGSDWTSPLGKEVDLKATQGKALRFKFNRRNKFAHRAQIVAFAKVDYSENEAIVTLLGWTWKADVNLFLRHDERYDFVNYETLRRQKLIYPITMLKDM